MACCFAEPVQGWLAGVFWGQGLGLDRDVGYVVVFWGQGLGFGYFPLIMENKIEKTNRNYMETVAYKRVLGFRI